MDYKRFLELVEVEDASRAYVEARDAAGGLPENRVLAYPIIAKLHQSFRDSIECNDTFIDALVAEMRKALGRTGAMATDDDLKLGLDHPELPLNLSFATGVRMVRYHGLPQTATMTWRLPGVDVNLCDTKRVWAGRTAPVDPRPEGSEYGRAVAPLAE
jgi:hypothetical protein